MVQLPLMLIAASLAVVTPLSDTQKIMLEDVAPPSPSVDEAGLYALLGNASQWDADVSRNLAGSTVPDYAAIRNEPDQHRGQVFAIDGVIESYMNMGRLSRPGWETARVMVVRTDHDGLVMVYLTDPPQLPIASTVGQHELPESRGSRVRLAGRFFKFVMQPNQQGQAMLYPVFVGRSAMVDEQTAATTEGSGRSWGMAAIFVPVLGLVVAYGLIRRMGSRGPSRLEQRRLQRENEKDQRERPAVELRDDLPSDPALAMAALEKEREEAQSHGNRPG